jgi:two-component system KDP operon response regulator KdpE
VTTVPQRVLVVDDEPHILRGLSASLAAAGYAVTGATSVASALREAALRNPDVVVLDLLLPDGTGLEVCRRLREWTQVPIIVVSAQDAETDKIAALDAGADDYVTKPYATGELLARLRAVSRRAAAAPGEAPTVAFGAVEVDMALRTVRRDGREVHLTPREYALLAELARHAGRVITHPALLRAVWGPGFERETHYLRVYMGRLRAKLEADPSDPEHLLTEGGVGYRLRPDA